MASADYILGIEYLTPDATTPVSLSNYPKNPDGSAIACVAYIRCGQTVDASTKGNVAIRWSDIGIGLPTKDVGIELLPGQVLEICSSIEKLRFIGIAINSRIEVWYAKFPKTINQFSAH
jgi:hypothetical protein